MSELINVDGTGVVFMVPAPEEIVDLPGARVFILSVVLNAIGIGGFHPDNQMRDYAFNDNGTEKILFSKVDAEVLDATMDKCFEVYAEAEMDIYADCMFVFDTIATI